MKPDEMTRQVLARSTRWQKACAKLDLMKVADSPPIDFEGWTVKDHREAFDWATGGSDNIPFRLLNYLEGVR